MSWVRAIMASILLLAGGAAGAMEPAGLSVVASGALGRAAAGVPVGGRLRLENVRVAETGEPAALVLERFEVFTGDATVTIHGAGGERVVPAPRNAYFRGVLEGQPQSRVFLGVLEDGTTQGIVNGEDGGTYLIGGDPDRASLLGAPLEMRRVDNALATPPDGGFACGNSGLPQSPHPVEDAALGSSLPAALTAPAASPEALPLYTARVAIETDFEFYQKFNNGTDAANYVGNLLGYSSTIYTNETSTSLKVQSLSLWTTSGDPWGQTSTLCGLMEFGRYWNLNRGGVSRTIAHFLSGKTLGGGVAWLGVLCSGGFASGAGSSCPGLPPETGGNWGGGYGFTANITGSFNVNNPTVVWDILAVSHEIGHNFNSPHSHCYNGVGGNSNPIDQCHAGECQSGCNCNTATLPGPSGQHSGTIMSYCHLLSPGFANVALSFGTNHPFGVQPGREATRMSAFVVSRAVGNPSCLAVQTNGIFSDGLESGAMTSWQ